jgi:iron complex outermembrane receptor protein
MACRFGRVPSRTGDEMLYTKSSSYASLVVALAIAASPTAFAQTSDTVASSPASTDVALGEIIVTAEKRSERLQDVPIAITAVDRDAITESRITRADELVQVVPGLQANGGITASQPIYAIRGVSMNDYSLNQEGPVATYNDEVYKGNPAILGVSLYDLERVEVLRGPQGTLYGKNATGGAVNLITRAPDFTTEGYLDLTGGNYARREVQGAFQAPLSDRVAVRVAFTIQRADGWFKNFLPGEPDMSETRDWGVRTSVLFKASDKLTFTLRLSTSLENPIHDGVYSQPGPLGIGAGVYDYYHSLYPLSDPNTDYFRPSWLCRRCTQADNPVRQDNRTYAIALNTKYEFADDLTLTAITSYDTGNFFYEEDGDGSPLQVINDNFYDDDKQFTQDLRIATTGDGPFKVLIGAYYFLENIFNINGLPLFTDIDANGDGVVNHLDCEAASPVACNFQNQFHQHKTSVAFYTDDSYKITDQLTLLGGLRFTHDEAALRGFMSQEIGTDGVVIANLIPGSTTDLSATADRGFTTNNLSPKIGLDYKTSGGTLLYATYSRGYRGGSFNAQAYFLPEELSTTKSETVTDYEIGSKTSLFEHRLELDSAVFYYDYRNQQFIDVDPKTGAQPLVNLPLSRIFGAELEFAARPIRDLRVTGGICLLNSRVEQGTLDGQSIVGNSIVNAPKYSGTMAVDWDLIHANWGSVSARVDGNYVSRQYFDLENRSTAAQGGYGLLNARIGWKTVSGNAGVDFWIRNIANTFYTTDKIDLLSGFGFIYNRVGDPRTFGATAAINF